MTLTRVNVIILYAISLISVTGYRNVGMTVKGHLKSVASPEFCVRAQLWRRKRSKITSCAGGRHNMPRPPQVDL